MNDQKPLPHAGEFTGSYGVVDIWKTIQGEAIHAGTPAAFCRLHGCNLQCPLCDTDYTSTLKPMSVEEIHEECMKLNVPLSTNYLDPLLVITGGEPFRQDLTPLCGYFTQKQWRVQIETNGTFQINDFIGWQVVDIVCSPKTPKIDPSLVEADAWKYVVSADAVDEKDGLPTSALGMKKPPARPLNSEQVYIQPCDDHDPVKNTANMHAAIRSCLKFGYRLCLQVHKIAGLP